MKPSQLLLEEPPLQVLPTLATAIGLEEAVTATELGTFSYGDVLSSGRTVQALEFWGK